MFFEIIVRVFAKVRTNASGAGNYTRSRASLRMTAIYRALH
jgi:hypothetical protein